MREITPNAPRLCTLSTCSANSSRFLLRIQGSGLHPCPAVSHRRQRRVSNTQSVFARLCFWRWTSTPQTGMPRRFPRTHLVLFSLPAFQVGDVPNSGLELGAEASVPTRAALPHSAENPHWDSQTERSAREQNLLVYFQLDIDSSCRSTCREPLLNLELAPRHVLSFPGQLPNGPSITTKFINLFQTLDLSPLLVCFYEVLTRSFPRRRWKAERRTLVRGMHHAVVSAVLPRRTTAGYPSLRVPRCRVILRRYLPALYARHVALTLCADRFPGADYRCCARFGGRNASQKLRPVLISFASANLYLEAMVSIPTTPSLKWCQRPKSRLGEKSSVKYINLDLCLEAEWFYAMIDGLSGFRPCWLYLLEISERHFHLCVLAPSSLVFAPTLRSIM